VPVKRVELYSSDGSINICKVNQYDSDGYLLTSHEILNVLPTDDFTCDDAITSGRLTEYTYNNDKTKLYSATETDTGITACSTSTFDSDNKQLSKRWYNSPLTHQVCDEENDTITMLVKSTYIAELQYTYSSSRDNGADNEWGTEDDVISEITTIITLAPGIYGTATSTSNGKITSIAKATHPHATPNHDPKTA
jgi:hypothetical protein